MKMKMKNAGLAVVILAGIFISMSEVLASTDDYEKIKEELSEQISASPLSSCREALVPAFDIELKQFFDFLETNFQNKSSNSSLTNIAISRYRDYKRALNSLFGQLNPSNDLDNETYQVANASYLTCSKIKDEYIAVGKEVLLDHIKKTAAQKQTAVMLEKYQAINSKLRELNMEISMLYGYFVAFKEKLPGFLQDCITSG